MSCPRCGEPIACRSCGAEIESSMVVLEDLVTKARSSVSVPSPPRDDAFFLIVARGHRELLEQIRGVVGDLGWVQVLEDRRREANLLPRTGGPPDSIPVHEP